MKRIICIGNRYVREDAAGPAVHRRLLRGALPPDVEVIDGGLAGLDLLRFVEGAARVVFVDAVRGLGPSERPNGAGVVVLEAADAAALATDRYDHGAGLPYLLRILPQVCEGALPPVLLVGIEGTADDAVIDRAAALALQAALGPGDRSQRCGDTA